MPGNLSQIEVTLSTTGNRSERVVKDDETTNQEVKTLDENPTNGQDKNSEVS